MEKLSGTVEEIRFRNEENGWTVIVLDIDGSPMTAAGTLPPVTPGDCLELEGELVVHPRFGTQLRIDRASVAQPHTVYGILRFLGSGLISGVGQKTAARIVDMFGTSSIEVIERTPQKLTKIKGISKSKAQRIHDDLIEVGAQREAILFLTGYGVSVNMAAKLYETYGAATVSTVKTDPYILVDDVGGIGFLTADKIAQSVGIERVSMFRVRAGILYVLKSACDREGNTYLPVERLKAQSLQLLGIDDDGLFESALDGLRLDRRVVFPFEGAAMSAPFYSAERSAATKLVKRLDGACTEFKNVSAVIDRFESINGIKLHPSQRDAVERAVKSGASVITGGPGTGKTTIIKCILFVLDSIGMTAALLAPTGRAAKRMTEGCDRDASTIHRALLALDEGEKLSAGAVIVDEFSMVDIFLFRMLLDSLSDSTKLIMVGDADQLPSVGAGNVLRDIIFSGLVPVTRLSHIYRQSERSLIALAAHDINAGRVPDLSARDGDFFCFKMRSPEDVANMTVELATTRITGFCGIPPSHIQVIAALKNGVAGVNSLNARLQSALNGGAKKHITVGDYTFAPGDRVMHTVNNYELEWSRLGVPGKGVFNGDIGSVVSVFDTGEIEVEFEDGRRAIYAGELRRQLILSYAVTVHKSQGCEFDAIVMPVVAGSPMMMTRNLLYTAITRAKKLAVLVGDEYNIKRMVDNNYIAERFSALGFFVDEAKKNMERLFSE